MKSPRTQDAYKETEKGTRRSDVQGLGDFRIIILKQKRDYIQCSGKDS